jgi:hypothetical protein
LLISPFGADLPVIGRYSRTLLFNVFMLIFPVAVKQLDLILGKTALTFGLQGFECSSQPLTLKISQQKINKRGQFGWIKAAL